MKRVIASLALACVLASGAAAQKDSKSWMEWSKKDAEKILNDSPWGQTQTQTDTREMFYTPTAPGQGGARETEGATNQATDIRYRIRFLTARPIRQALARLILLDNTGSDKALEERMRSFAESPPNDNIIVAVTYESKDGRRSGRALQAFSAATAATLKNTTYLQRKDGERLFLENYAPPGREGFGALFAFPRMVNGKPFVTPETGEVRFVSTVGNGVELNMRFNVTKMIYNGALEY